MEPILKGQQVFKYIPQRPPMVMIDTLWVSDEVLTRTGFFIQSDNLFVENGEFTAPGLMENIAQTAAIRAGYYYVNKNEPVPLGFIGGFKNLEILATPKVGTTIKTEVRLKQEVLDISIYEGKIMQDDALLVNCEMKIFVLEKSTNQ